MLRIQSLPYSSDSNKGQALGEMVVLPCLLVVFGIVWLGVVQNLFALAVVSRPLIIMYKALYVGLKPKQLVAIIQV
jgi:hypothetical protein